jgi:hypothetical protein
VDSTAIFWCICERAENTDAPSTSSKIKEQLIEVTRGLPTLKITATKLKNNRLLDFLNSGKKFLFIPAVENNSQSEKAFLQK